MNQFLRAFFNIPNASLLHMFSMNNEKSKKDKEAEEELFTRMKIILDIDIKELVETILNDVGTEDLYECLLCVLENLNFYCKKEEGSSIRFLIFQLWLMLEGNYFEGGRKIYKILTHYPELAGITTEENLQENVTRDAKFNFINYLLADDEAISYIEKYDEGLCLREDRKYFCNSYSEAYSEMRAVTLVGNARDMYCEKFQMIPKKGTKQRKYSVRVISTFFDYNKGNMDGIRKKHKANSYREKMFRNYRELSFNAMKYLTEMLYVYNLFDKTASNSINYDRQLENGSLENFVKHCTELFMIPDIDCRMHYADQLWNQIKEIEELDKKITEEAKSSRMRGEPAFGMTQEGDTYYRECRKLKKVLKNIRFDASVYYPLLILTSIELVREYTKRYRGEQNPYQYIIGQLNHIYKGMSENERNVKCDYEFYKYAGKIPYTCYGLYANIRKKYFSTEKFNMYFGKKITFKSADYYGMMCAYLTASYTEFPEDEESLDFLLLDL